MKRYLLLACLSLAGCHEAQDAPIITIHASSIDLTLSARGELHSTRATVMNVPGFQWAPRQIQWMLPDGSAVREGDVVARFSALQSKQDLALALIDLDRNALTRLAKERDIVAARKQVNLDIVQVTGQEEIAQRYARATNGAISRNDILDAVLDKDYLDKRLRSLKLKDQESTKRNAAQLAVVDAQRNRFESLVATKKSDLDALELRAPHDGVLVLERDWSDQVPHIGGSLWAGTPFASLPDMTQAEVQLSIAQLEAAGIEIGERVELHPLGVPSEQAVGKVSWISELAQPKGAASPVKYLTVKVALPSGIAERFHWAPGQQFVSRVVLYQGRGLMVPNVALLHGEGRSFVNIRVGSRVERREVRLGVRGSVRSQVVSGLSDGDQVVLEAKPS